MKTTPDVAIVGSGFAGTTLARCLAARGKKVVLFEKGEHPRFAIGESSTPLAAIALERLAARYGLDDLDALAAHGRWLERFPELRRGLKRGFTFYRHEPGEDLRPEPATRLLVAASPDDAVSDSHWLRSDVDAFFVDRAIDEGVEYFGATEVTDVQVSSDGVAIEAEQNGNPLQFNASFVVDASGPEAVVARQCGATSLAEPSRFRSGVVFSHFSGVRPLAEIWQESGVAVEPGPYPDERAAVHHLLDEGWVYVLPFDHDCVSAGLVADGDLEESRGRSTWCAVLDKYPTLAAQFETARELRPLETRSRLQYRLSAAAGERWAALPHVYAFFDPMFSTGIAWSLLGVERLSALLAGERSPSAEELQRYARRLGDDADQIERLIYGAYLARQDFEVYAAHSQLYFALVSFEEVRQRIFDDVARNVWSSSGFLGAGEEECEQLLFEAVRRLEDWQREGCSRELAEKFVGWAEQAIAARNVAGLADSRRRNLYPVDLELLVERASLLGLSSAELRELVPRLRGRGPRAGADGAGV